MKLKSLKKELDRIQEVKLIDRQIDEATQILGFVRTENMLNLFLLNSEEPALRQAEGAHPMQSRRTNRTELKGFAGEEKNPFREIRTVQIGEAEFHVSASMNVRCSETEWESMLFLETFLRAGKKLGNLEDKELKELFIHALEIEGSFAVIPEMDTKGDIRFEMQGVTREVLVEQPMLLKVGEDFPDRLYFGGKEEKEPRWVQINRVHLLDMWEKATEDMEKLLEDLCPRGMCFPLIEYECEEELFLQFYTREWLEAAPESRNGCTSFFASPKQKTGKLGLRMRTALIQQPVESGAEEVETELFRYSMEETPKDIVLRAAVL